MTSAAAADATAVSGRLLPGIGITREPLASIQASVTCWGLAPTSVGHLGERREGPLYPVGAADTAHGAPRDEHDAEVLAVLELAF